MTSRRRKASNPDSSTDRRVDGAHHCKDWTTWAHQVLEGAAGVMSDEEMAVLERQVKSLARAEPSAAPLPPDPTAPTVVRDRKALKQVSAHLESLSEVVIDLETSALEPFDGEIVGVGLSVADASYYIPTGHRFEENKLLRPDQLPVAVVAKDLRLGRLLLVAHDAKPKLRWLRRHTGVTCTFVWDVMLAARLLASHLPAELKDLAARELDAPDWSMGKEEIKAVQFLTVDRVARSCAKDCHYTLKLYQRQQACLS
jgi:DNA polymerase I-like protein with 3'-5' exonuclease and polymerase domains